MLFQLGDKQFSKSYAPSTWSISGDEANYAEHAIINGKPRLQLTGETLQEITFRLKLHAKHCNPAQEIAIFDDWKSRGEILPLLLGNGQYKGDYVLKSATREILTTFDDGTIQEADITLNLLEYVPYSKAEQQNAAARKNAFALGDKEQISRRPAQGLSPHAEAHAALMLAQREAWEAAEAAQTALETGEPENFIQKIKGAAGKADEAMRGARQKVNDLSATITGATGIISSIDQSIERLGELSGLMSPPITLIGLSDSITNLQTANRLINTSSLGFTQSIILRRF